MALHVNKTVDYRAAMGAQRGIGKQEVLPPNHEGLDAALRPGCCSAPAARPPDSG